MDHRRIFTLDKDNFPIEKMQDLIKYLHDRQQHYILMIDPAVADYDYEAYNRGIEMGAFMKNQDGSPYRGVVWPVSSILPSKASYTQNYAGSDSIPRLVPPKCDRVLGRAVSEKLQSQDWR